MSFANTSTRSSIHPNLHYRDAPAAIEWLCAALGFEKRAVFEDGERGIARYSCRDPEGRIWWIGSYDPWA